MKTVPNTTTTPEIFNYTLHEINVDDMKGNGNSVIYPSQGKDVSIRLEHKEVIVGNVNGFPLVEKILTGHNLPDEKEGVLLLVSAMVLEEAKKMGRPDCIAPNTGSTAERNDKGHIISVKGFVS